MIVIIVIIAILVIMVIIVGFTFVGCLWGLGFRTDES